MAVAATLTIGKAHLTVTADNKTKVYGAPNSTLTYSITGFVNGQTLATSGVTGSASHAGHRCQHCRHLPDYGHPWLPGSDQLRLPGPYPGHLEGHLRGASPVRPDPASQRR